MINSFCLKAINLLVFILFLTLKPTEAADPYAVISEKNLFRPDRTEWVIEKPDSKMVDKKIDPGKLELLGTIIIGDQKSALIHEKKSKKKDKKTEIYSLGDYVGGYVISAIDEKRVILDYYGEKLTLYLHEGKETAKVDIPPPPEEKPKPKKIKGKKEKKGKKDKRDDPFDSSKIPEALAKSPFMSEENMKKILEFNKEIMEEMKESGGTLDQEGIKDKVEKFREKFMDEIDKMEK
jgi:type II secretory pathway component PulC